VTHIGIFDYGAGNLHSLLKAIEGDGRSVSVDTDIRSSVRADILILPGVGAFGAAVAAMKGAQAYVREALADGKPCLGVCLGMQMLFDASEEDAGSGRREAGSGRREAESDAGIGLIPGRVTRLQTPKVPHMGWNEIEWVGGKREEGRETREVGSQSSTRSRFPLPASPFPLPAAYFANAYVCEPDDNSAVVAWTTHQAARFASVVRTANTVGVQFHPEKSSASGRAFVNAVIDELLQCK
jgi:glutamine amidotransferase